MKDDVAIKVDQVYKDFKLPHEKVGSVKNIFTNFAHAVSASRTYTKQHALKDISLEIKQGEFFGIVGRNGSGKSTLLKILAGIYQPTKGKVQVRGKLVPFIELGVGFNPELTGRDNIYLNGALLGFDRKEIDEMYDGVVAFAELEEFMDQKLKNYSSGMQVRLAFSMAVRAKADILLIDEVLAVGDADFQRKCFGYFKKVKKDNTTVVFVSHDMETIREYCDRAMMIEKSKIVQIGDTNEIAQKYTKLFTKQSTNFQNTDNKETRWGEGSVITENIEVTVSDNNVVIKVKIRANAFLEAPILGMRIRSAAGQEITGTNTKLEHINIPNLNNGESLFVEWRLPNVFSDGTYYVDPAILLHDSITVADWWDEASYFVVKRQRRLPYVIDLNFEVKVEGPNKYV